ncbi:MAG TPA: O-antigen ligase family protein [Bacillota bacterium]|nr:O-antigen ligase family protein [Bacillota bacterium]
MAPKTTYNASMLDKNNSHNNVKQYFFLFLLFLLVWYPPYFRGMFFDYETMYFHMASAIAFIVFLFTRPKSVLKRPTAIMDYAGFGLVLAYALSTIVAVNTRTAVGEALKVLNYFMVYIMVAYGVRNFREINWLTFVLYLSGLGVAVRGLAAAYGIWEYNGAFLEGMIYSTLQYHNATAIFLGAASILGFYLVARQENILAKILLSASNYIIFMAMFGAVSRGATLVYVVVIIPFVLGMPKGFRVQTIFNVIFLLLSMFLTSNKVLAYTPELTIGMHLLWVTMGIAVNALGQLAIKFMAGLSIWNNRKAMVSGALAITLVVVVVGALQAEKLVPAHMISRFQNVNFESHTVQERLTFYKDALKLIGERPVIGYGGGGWNATYRKYQTYNYNSTEVHNHFLQTWIDAGTLGFILFLALWIGLLVSGHKIYHKSESTEDRALIWTIVFAAVAIGLHSAGDFSMSLGSVCILLWALFGAVRGGERIEALGKLTSKEVKTRSLNQEAQQAVWTGLQIAGAVLAIAFLVFAINLSDAAESEQLAQDAYNKKDLEGTIANFEKAAESDPYESKYNFYLGQLYQGKAMQTKSQEDMQKSLEYAERGTELNSGDPQGYFFLTQAYFSAGNYAEGVKAAEEAQKLIPLRQEGYTTLAQAYAVAGNALLQQGQNDKAREMFDKALGVPKMIEKLNAEMSPFTKKMWNPPLLTVDSQMSAIIEEVKKVR